MSKALIITQAAPSLFNLLRLIDIDQVRYCSKVNLRTSDKITFMTPGTGIQK